MLFDSLSFRRSALLSALPVCAVLMTGCTLGSIALSGPEATPIKVSAVITGTVHGGQSPISGSTMQLYSVGNGSYGAAAHALIPAGGVGSVSLTAGGSGYTSVPTVSFTGGGGTGAAATATINGSGTVTKLTLTAPGSGYTSTPTITFTGGSGTGATATAVAVPTAGVLTDANGRFNISGDFTCPSSTSIVYLTATGGNPGLANGTNNTAIALATPLGACGNLSSSTVVSINELTTAAMAFAMGQYFTTTFGSSSTDSFGAPNTTQAQVGITNAYNTVGNLVNIANGGDGSAVTTKTLTTTGVGSITVTPESLKLGTIGNILAACVNTLNSSSTACSTLFSDVTPTGGTAPTDTLQAAVYMSLNPTSTNANGSSANLTALYGLSSGFAQFSGLSTQPTDWTLGITYGSNTTVAGAGTYLLYDPEHVANDASGNVWLANFNTTSTGNSVTELSATGTPLVQTLTTIYGTNRELAIDPSGNVWLPDSYGLVGSTVTSAKGTTVYEYVPGNPGTVNTFVTGNDPAAIAFDGVGNAFIIEPSFANTTTANGGASTGALEEIPANSSNGTLATTIASSLYTEFSSLVVDKNYTIWVTGGNTINPGTAAGGVNGVYQFLKNTGTGTGYPSTPTATAVGVATAGATTVSSLTAPEGAVAVNNNGDVLIANFGSTANSTLGGIAGTSTTTLANATNVPFTLGVTKQQFIAVDGAGNIWTSQAASGGAVYAYTPSGGALSPSVGFAHTYKTPYQVAIDPSGNVWVGNSSASSSASVQGFVTEIVGAAIPVVTPIAAGLPTTAGGTSTLGTRP